MYIFERIKIILDYIGGCTEQPPEKVAAWLSPWLWGLWWAFLAMLVIFFCGQTSKFIYIDF
jgi:hypothetical protein